MRATTIKGTKVWESCEGERLLEPDKCPKDLFGWHKVTVEGRVMWESPDGLERVMDGGRR